MTTPNPSDRSAPLDLTELFTHYLRSQASAQAAGLGFPEVSEEVVPHEAVPVQPVDPRLAWTEALAAVSHLAPKVDPRSWPVPPDWPALVTAQEPAVAVAFCLGNFPQLVRNLQPLLAGADPAALRVPPARPVVLPSLVEWAAAQHDAPQGLLAAAVLRLARHFDEAARLLRTIDGTAEWRAIRANEEAALAWHRGRGDEALRLWQGQEASVPVLFNRGMAALFLGQPAAARKALAEVVDQLPENGAWHHLGRLYLTLAQ
jgi:hypothetical protein